MREAILSKSLLTFGPKPATRRTRQRLRRPIKTTVPELDRAHASNTREKFPWSPLRISVSSRLLIPVGAVTRDSPRRSISLIPSKTTLHLEQMSNFPGTGRGPSQAGPRPRVDYPAREPTAYSRARPLATTVTPRRGRAPGTRAVTTRVSETGWPLAGHTVCSSHERTAPAGVSARAAPARVLLRRWSLIGILGGFP